ncbi:MULTISPECIES: SDR family NAD(P)-dependent oxidoreductase [Rhodococcus]|uniref:SDR family NAD(P)-dependent oxidoreductase n=1 Tax=Rhodococcus TaxID=1827 RepID=UPI0009270E6B|nr:MULTISPECIES: SDR family oxidoreductase [Rhodococcus]OLL18954.1 oxidoreductase [Rhodococcus sp. M8]PND52709.1 KR domain-containing protein [Rhodococcus sp. ENV425]QPG47643.1 SDR family oxidoreductase [Rhodococcus sp. M8]USC14538.1 SDR family oxidoreductase [Rhodococcus sp. 11-3]WKW97880.1 SDR family oxidoreductase [Rhodococcus aetherivorans]
MGALEGRVALVTGAGMGIGRGIAAAFAREGADVVVAEIDETAGAGTARWLRDEWGVRAHFQRTDITDKGQVHAMVDAAVERFGRLDILVNNAWRSSGYARFENMTDEQLRGGFDMAVMAAFWAMRRALPELERRGTGRVINLCSLNGVNAHMYSVQYNAAKEALRTLTRTAAREWAPKQICCNVICPGAQSEAFRRVAEANPQMAAASAAANPMGRIGDPVEDIGSVAVFLAGDASRYVTGNTLFVDGGAHINGVQWAPQVD